VSDARKAPFGVVLLGDVVRATDINPNYPDATDGEGKGARNFHLIRRHRDIRAFGVNGITGNAGDKMVESHDEPDEEANLTDGHQELFVVMSGHAVFTWTGKTSTPPPERCVRSSLNDASSAFQR
jgi:hypothetical protein